METHNSNDKENSMDCTINHNTQDVPYSNEAREQAYQKMKKASKEYYFLYEVFHRNKRDLDMAYEDLRAAYKELNDAEKDVYLNDY